MNHLLEPLHTGALSLKNRLVMPPMATSKCDPDGKVSQGLLDYYDEKSRGGYFSLIIIEHSFIRQDGKAGEHQLSVSNDGDVEGLSKLAEVIHRNGCKCVMQINHAGGQADRAVTGMEPLGPSALPIPPKGIVPRELTEGEIEEIVCAFSRSARRVKEAGFDGVELHGAHGYLLNQFYSPITNRRTDAYGGNILGRIRAHLQVIASVRAAVGDDFPLLLRLGACDYMEGGTTAEDSAVAAREFEKAGICLLDISGGLCRYTVPGLTGQGYFSPVSQTVKQAVSIPVLLTGGVTQPQAAESLLADGKADLIGVGRAVYHDSDWAKHTVESFS